MTKDEQVKSKRELTLERLRGKYPDQNFDDDEQLFGRISDDYDQYDKKISDYEAQNDKFAKMFSSNPKSARLMMDWRDGEDPVVALVRMYGKDIKDAIENDPELVEKIAAANKEYMDRVAEEKNFEEQYMTNYAASMEELDKLQQEEEFSDKDANEAVAWLIDVARDAMIGKISRDAMVMAIKAKNYDVDVTEASQEGEVRGRNQKAEMQLRKPKRGDGTPNLGGSNGDEESSRRRMPDLGAIDRLGGDSAGNIFERGGEKRTPIRR
jgi:hypothetical protein